MEEENDIIKKRHKNYFQGIYKVTNLQKYKGKKNPVFRSRWELKFMRFLDMNEMLLNGVLKVLLFFI